MAKRKTIPIKTKYRFEEKLGVYVCRELKDCSTHGLPYIVDKQISWFERLFWFVSFVGCTALIYVLLITQYARYIKTPIVMSVEMDYFNWNVSFPALTFCPSNKLDEDEFEDLKGEYFNKTKTHLGTILWSIASASLDTIDSFEIESNDLNIIPPEEYASIAARLFKKMEPGAVRSKSDIQFNVEPAMTELGMCHVINSNVAIMDNPLKNNVTLGYKENHAVISVVDSDVFAEIDNYDENFKVYVHGPDDVAMLSSTSYSFDFEGLLSPTVQVWSTRISQRLKDKSLTIRACRLVSEPQTQMSASVYTRSHCLVGCRARLIYALCHCLPHFYKPLPHERICNLYQLPCVAAYSKEISSLSVTNESLRSFYPESNFPRSSRDCNCPTSCVTDIYKKDREAIFNQIGMKKFRMSLSKFPKVRVVRDVIFSFHDIILRSGGVMNLCIGASIISLAEFVVIAVRRPIIRAMYAINNRLKLF